jgi:hypothetical protein
MSHVSCILNGCGYKLPPKGKTIRIKNAYKAHAGVIDIDCRVLKVYKNAGAVEVMWIGSYNYLPALDIYPDEASEQWHVEEGQDHTIKVLKYAGSDLDKYLNGTTYNTFTDRVKAAIVPNNKLQCAYDIGWWATTVTDPDFELYALHAKPHQTGRVQELKKITSFYIGDRYVYSLGLNDIVDYMQPAHGARIQGTAMNKFLFGEKDPTPVATDAIKLWTTSAFLSTISTDLYAY